MRKLIPLHKAAATFVLVALGQTLSAQEPPIYLSGIWWTGAPVPLLPAEAPPTGMGMGMGGGAGGPITPGNFWPTSIPPTTQPWFASSRDLRGQ